MNEVNKPEPTEYGIIFNSNEVTWHKDIQLKGRIRKSIEIATAYDGFTVDDALRVLKEEIAWLEMVIR